MIPTKKIGFCCKWVEIDKKGRAGTIPELNCTGTTMAWLKRQSRGQAEEKLGDILQHNISSINKLVRQVGDLDESLRMVRLGSDILCGYTFPDWQGFYRDPAIVAYCEKHFREVGDLARSRGVRLSFHPGQFTVLASDNEDIVNKSIEEFEYHADMARWMGYGVQFQDFKINVHIAGRQGPRGIQNVLARLSPEARNCLTIENDEISWGIDASLELADSCALVLDIHHHWIHSGEYISPEDDRCKRVIDSWRGVRPVIHYSVSREDVLPDHAVDVMPDCQLLLESGHKKGKLRAHSDFYWNTAVNEWALSFWNQFDIQCEAKAKNLASFALYEQAQKLHS